jgi:hypothetical protein
MHALVMGVFARYGGVKAIKNHQTMMEQVEVNYGF